MAIKAYLQLVRLPNVFTAAADSLAGWLLVEGTFREPNRWVPLMIASACTYAGGIVFNDIFDFEVDRVERPERPLPSGRIPRPVASSLGTALLVVGMVLSIASGTSYGWLVEFALIGCVLAYDAGLKRPALGPEVMGACRGLNLLLGMSHHARLGGPAGWLAAASYAAFVAGVTWVSRSEVVTGRWKEIAVGLAFQNLALLGLLIACASAGSFPNAEPFKLQRVTLGAAALTALGFAVCERTGRALRNPVPSLIQAAVKFGILSLVWLHVGLLLGVRGVVAAGAVGLLWVPARWIGRWVYST